MKKTVSMLALMSSLVIPATSYAEVKIGFATTLSGPAAALGQDQVDGFNLALEQKQQHLGGQEVEMFIRDDQLKPQVGTQVVRELIEKEDVDALVGLGFSNVLMANLRRLDKSGTVAIATNAGPSPMAGKACSKNVFSVAWQNDGAAEAMGKLAESRGIKRIYLMAPNYQAGKDMLSGFKRFYKGTVVNEVYTQVGQADYSAELAQLTASDAEALFVFYPGGMGVNFTKQFNQAGLADKVPYYSVFTVDGTTLPALRATAAGAINGAMWSPELPVAANEQFVKAFKERYDRTPSLYAAAGYDAANLLDKAIGDLNGDISDKAAFAGAVHDAGAEFESVRGPFAFNINNLPIQNYYAFNAEEKDGNVHLVLTETPLENHKDAYYEACEVK